MREELLRKLRWHAARRSSLQLELLLAALVEQAKDASLATLQELLRLFELEDPALLDLLLGRRAPDLPLSPETLRLLQEVSPPAGPRG